MKAFKLWGFIALSWLFIDWIIAGDLLLRWAGVHLETGVVLAGMAPPAMLYWMFHQRPNAWGKSSTYKGFLVCALAAFPAIPLIRVIQVIASNPKVVNNVPWFVALLFFAGMASIIAAKMAICVHWWRKLMHELRAMDELDV